MTNTIPGFMTEFQFAQTVGLSVWGIRAWRKRGYGPPITKFGRMIYYRLTDVDAFLAAPNGG
jgi:hypothetical protein